MLNNIFELLTTAADVSQFISLKKTFDNNDSLNIMHHLDKQDDAIFGTIIENQKLIISMIGEIFMDIKKMMNKIIDNDSKEDMDSLGDMFVDMVYMLKCNNKKRYDEINYEMYKMAYGEHLNEELAHKWVSEMKNKDGTVGEHWSYEQTEQVRKQYAPNEDPCDFYAVINMVYSDYYCDKFDTTTYVNLAKDWLNDKDVSKCKTLKYYMFVVK